MVVEAVPFMAVDRTIVLGEGNGYIRSGANEDDGYSSSYRAVENPLRVVGGMHDLNNNYWMSRTHTESFRHDLEPRAVRIDSPSQVTILKGNPNVYPPTLGEPVQVLKGKQINDAGLIVDFQSSGEIQLAFLRYRRDIPLLAQAERFGRTARRGFEKLAAKIV